MILDTNAVSALFAGHPELKTKLAHSSRHHLPVIVLGEYRFGLSGSRQSKTLLPLLRRSEEESFILSVDRDTAEFYAAIRYELKRNGHPIPENDIWIAALARQHQLDIASQDGHFDHINAIKRISW